ncbi:hypothetical protein HME9302_00617 [Alteripontixanthobacter maritimus]|uniref:Uncharacterized protein n=1 Tax=Alteripontixanthobacter maritimus TaxID=2161824 RepID=A0A369Q930_9SPHN|nr:hypothetical protein [Alteripontixanthobacter maritimus]RDC59429.1 hypothetical protein HME9302_00617 [Alteripontixanthobacter maritimus]
MSFWTAAVIIVAIGAIASIIKARYNAQAGITEDMMGNQTINHRPDAADRQELEAARREVEELRERVKVLERIATDSSARTAAEIEQLRDR